MTIAASNAGEPTPITRQSYDAVTIALHWVTAIVVLVLFVTAISWGRLPRSMELREPLQALHISLGILLAALFVFRAIWRASAGRRLPAVDQGLQNILSKLVHGLLYLLLAWQIVLGFVLRWFQGEAFWFFGLFSIPALIGTNSGLEHTVENVHNIVAWSIIYLVGSHAAAALLHHYWRKDGVLKRMIPALKIRGLQQ